MNRFTQFLCNLMVLGVALALTTPALAGPVAPSPRTATPCTELWGVSRICISGQGQSRANNVTITMCIIGRIVDPNRVMDPSRLGSKAHRIPVCQGEEVTVKVTDLSGTPTITGGGSLLCTSAGCTGVVNVTVKLKVVSSDGKDTDRMTLIPK